MKFSVTIFLAAVLGVAIATSPPFHCRCWADWEPINEGTDWHCKEKSSARTFHCNIEEPPKCICKEKGKNVELPRGETNCVGIDTNRYEKTNCETSAELEAWFNKYPQYRLYF